VVVLRVAVEDDLEVIHGIELSVYPTAWTMNFFRLMLSLSGELFLVAMDDGELIGYTVGELNKMGTVADPKIVGHVLNVAVTEEHQGEGVGTLLMDELELRLQGKGAEVAYLEVRESNAGAQAMYRKRGYQYVRTSKGYYGDEDGCIMMKSLV
jgi:ribosomal-protein-alanine N-acetyltransferase